MSVYGFDHRANSVSKVRNASKLGSQILSSNVFPQFVDGIALSEVRNWPTFRVVRDSPFFSYAI
jgi:hypothetical protein